MKHLNKLILMLFAVLATTSLNAQDQNNPWAVFIGVNAIDFYPTGANLITPQGRISSEGFGEDLFFKTDNWNTVTSFSSIGVGKYIGSGFSVEVTGNFNKITRLGQVDVDEESFINFDGTILYNFKDHIGIEWLDPYLGLGLGYFLLDGNGAGTYNTNLGVNFWITEGLALTVDTSYKAALENNDNDFFQHRFGIKFAFGGTDTDGDGVYDKKDACPDVAGLEEFNGCPDTDGDGIKDEDDACPGTAGLAKYDGCPDADDDGIIDSEDACPNTAGLASLAGCPDADEDGVKDGDDTCPNEAGPSANNGCPWPDTDGDGVLDKDDECPKVAGETGNKGCPVVTEEVQKELNTFAKTINFNTGKSSLSQDSEDALTSILAILAEYPNAKFTVEGHTDSVGNAEKNKALSQSRAQSVKDYLVKNGVDSSRLNVMGYGEEKPVANNNTSAGRAQNRRVEINLVK
jgi:outer membrane protein OmpA-like peptidoglycan-associated protein